MEFRSPPDRRQADSLKGFTGAILCGIAKTLEVAPCREKTDCLGGLTGKGFLKAIHDFLVLIGNTRLSFHNRLLYVHYYQQAGHQFFPPMQGGCVNQHDLETDLFDEGFDEWAVSHDKITTTRLVIAVMQASPRREFSEYVAGSIPADVVDQINYTLYRVLVAACQQARLDNVAGRKLLLLQFTKSDPVIVI